MWDNKLTCGMRISDNDSTGLKEAGHTAIQPLLCCVAEVVAMMTGLVMRVVSCY